VNRDGGCGHSLYSHVTCNDCRLNEARRERRIRTVLLGLLVFFLGMMVVGYVGQLVTS